MNVLALDTSSNALVLGLQAGGRRLERFELVERSHSREILPAIIGLFEEAGLSLRQLDAIVYGKGPGSFTGLRITVGVVQGLAYGLDIPVVPVSSLACLAQGEYRGYGNTCIVVALTARKQEVFFGAYEIYDGLARLVGKEAVLDVAEVPGVTGNNWVGVGSGWKLEDKLEKSLGVDIREVRCEVWPRPTDLLDLGIAAFERGEAIAAHDAVPEYLREQVASPGTRIR